MRSLTSYLNDIVTGRGVYGRGFPQFWQNFPLFFVPQEQTQSPAGRGLPQFWQKRPVFCVPQEQVHAPPAGAGFGLPQ